MLTTITFLLGSILLAAAVYETIRIEQLCRRSERLPHARSSASQREHSSPATRPARRQRRLSPIDTKLNAQTSTALTLCIALTVNPEHFI